LFLEDFILMIFFEFVVDCLTFKKYGMIYVI